VAQRHGKSLTPHIESIGDLPRTRLALDSEALAAVDAQGQDRSEAPTLGFEQRLQRFQRSPVGGGQLAPHDPQRTVYLLIQLLIQAPGKGPAGVFGHGFKRTKTGHQKLGVRHATSLPPIRSAQNGI